MFAARNSFFTRPPAGALDADASAYIAAVETSKGSSVTSGQSAAINDFYVATKAAGSYASLKRLYLPIWENAAANAIDLIARGSGTFVGAVTHNPEGIRSDGSTGYFDFGISPGAAGCELNSTSIIALTWDATHTALSSVDRYMGASSSDSGSRAFMGGTGSGNHGVLGPNNSSSLAATASGLFRGILVGSRDGAASRWVGFRSAAGWGIVNSDTTASSALNSTRNMFALCQNVDGVPSSFLRPQMALGVLTMGLGITQSQGSSLSLTLKTLWETCTGLTLP